MSSSNLSVMAWRNLWRNGRRTTITLCSIAFGMMLAILFTGMGDSSWTRMIDLAARSGNGHVTFQHPEYLDTPSLTKTITHVDTLLDIALKQHGVTKAVTRITGYAMLSTASESQGVFILGIDPANEDGETLSALDALVKGEMFRSSKDNGAVLGERLAENLGLKMGRKVVYTLTDKHGNIVSGLARVTGIVRTGAPTVDSGLCVLPIDTLRGILGYHLNEATQVALFVNDQRKSEDISESLRHLPDDQTAVVTWNQSRPELAGFISMKVSGTYFFELIIMILVSAGIFNTLFVSVLERMREFGIMMAIGFSSGQLFGLVMYESLWLSLVGLGFAVLVTAGPYYYMNTIGVDLTVMMGGKGSEIAGVVMDPILYVDIFAQNAVIIAAVVIVATLLSGIYPAWKAGRVVPVETIRIV